MPTITDATVVNSAYDTSGNGGRKLITLKNGSQYAVVKNGTSEFRIYKSVDRWATQGILIKTQTATSLTDVCLATDGIRIYVLYTQNNTTVTNLFLDENGVNVGVGSARVDSGQSTLGNVSLAINEAGTELHAEWASKNSVTSTASFNIRYAKGTINTDGSVTWGAVEQITSQNVSTANFNNPSIIVIGDRPIIFAEYNNGTSTNYIIALSPTGMANPPASFFLKSYSLIGRNDGYTQSSPSAIFVPQSVNGLANGRIWVAWHGTDSTDPIVYNIRSSYSDDGGVTWSTPTKLTSGNTTHQLRPTITANKNNNIFVLFDGQVTNGGQYQTRKIVNTNGTWGSITNVTNTASGSVLYVSSLFDNTFSLNFSEPLFIHQNNQAAKVGFYGTWSTTTISVTPGHLGTKADKNNLLSYVITTNETMSTITEKVNGVVTGTKTATSGQPLIAGLTQEQWDAIKYGKYADITGGSNTLTIEMGSEKWTYTFDKRLATDADILSVVKAVQDSQNTYLPAVKSKLASTVRSKGGTVNDGDSFEAIKQAVESLGNVGSKKWASGEGPGVSPYGTLTVTGLTFRPKTIIVRAASGAKNTDNAIYSEDNALLSTFSGDPSVVLATGNTGSSIKSNTPTIYEDGFSYRTDMASPLKWLAFE
ncbi:sialidase family protein [Pseudobacillus badius]|uniref:sialidase family protein n=1 Tax=Bacillus badius TaxID=1455 RepID=UPI0007B39443|nr:sialidase family protein [Bacillus badius]KZR60382.1 hypothetical protein A3781_09425 [Bacillus badius]